MLKSEKSSGFGVIILILILYYFFVTVPKREAQEEREADYADCVNENTNTLIDAEQYCSVNRCKQETLDFIDGGTFEIENRCEELYLEEAY